jgi:S-disulfanyl-L-cysteine oxidoreductase SoxD
MFSSPKRTMRQILAAVGLAAAGLAAAQSTAITGIGRPATAKEIAAWDIDVRPDFKGLPKGSGSVAKGTDVWEAKCASCHGIFGESNEIFSPLVGGTTAADVQSGRVARLTDEGFPGRTTLMKVPTISTLWDYINRAMPWNNPKTLTADEVYGVLAYMLNLGGIVPDNFTLSTDNIAEVQKKMPNRNGMTTQHGLWPGRTMGNGLKPDVQQTACMKGCAAEPAVASFLPEHARNAHGNLAEQNRLVGPQRGANTTMPEGTAAAAPTAAKTAAAASASSAEAVFKKHSCNACHGIENKLVGPSVREITKKYSGRADALDYLAGKIVAGGSGVWGAIPMPAQNLPAEEAKGLARWIMDGAKP